MRKPKKVPVMKLGNRDASISNSKNVYSILGIMGKVLGFQLITAFTKFLNDFLTEPW